MRIQDYPEAPGSEREGKQMTAGTRRVMVVLTILAIIAAAVVTLSLPANADHDGGVDEPFISPDMNSETYWEARFDAFFGVEGTTCTKYEGHTGSIPAGYEAVVVHDGDAVRVYGESKPVTAFGAFEAAGPMNAGDGGHNDGENGHHSWIEKCDIPTPPPPDRYACVDGQVVVIAPDEDGYEDAFETREEAEAAPGCAEETTTTTTTLPDNSTTTSTTVLQLSEWSAEAVCTVLTAHWGAGISRVDLYQVIGDDIIGDDGGIVPFTESGQSIDTAGALPGSEWLLIPVVLTGFDVEPDEITLTTEVCDEESTTTTVEASTTTDETLPFTGEEDGLEPKEAGLLGSLAFILIGAGIYGLGYARRRMS